MSRVSAVNVPRPVLLVAAALTVTHGVRQVVDVRTDDWIILAFAFIPARYGALSTMLPGGIAACIWTPLTYAFLHADWVHLGVNLIWMVSFGTPLARRFGALRFLGLSLFATLAGAGAHFALHAGDEGLMIGASGAVSGMMAATARFAFAPGGPLAAMGRPPRHDLPAEPLSRVLTRSRALGFVLIWFAANLLFGLAGDAVPGASGPIAWEAHVGGFLAGLLLFPILDPVPRPNAESAEPTPEDDLAS